MGAVTDAGEDGAPERVRRRTVPPTAVERTCLIVSEIALGIMLVLTAVDIVTRSLFNFSFEVSDDMGGYMLVVITFFSLAICHVNGSFHEVEFVQARLSERTRVISRMLFEFLALAASLLLTWQYVRLVLSSWRFGDRAPTYLDTPLWIPRLALPLGMAALCYALVRTLLVDWQRLRQAK